jgi:phage terminase large subunit-like protein
MKAGELQCQGEDFYDKTRTFITYEEIKNGTAGVDIKETSIGVQVGKPGVISEESNT